MLYIVTGGSGSGKSDFAEKLTMSFRENDKNKNKLWYIATMKPVEEDAEQKGKILRHQNMRFGKGFITREQYCNINELDLSGEVALLECISNLLANEMYLKEGCFRKNGIDLIDGNCDIATLYEGKSIVRELITDHILKPIVRLGEQAEALVVVTNEVSYDGQCITYDKSTALYVELLEYINRYLVEQAETFIEIFCGIPLWHKGVTIDV